LAPEATGNGIQAGIGRRKIRTPLRALSRLQSMRLRENGSAHIDPRARMNTRSPAKNSASRLQKSRKVSQASRFGLNLLPPEHQQVIRLK